jgi:hypothetical protein
LRILGDQPSTNSSLTEPNSTNKAGNQNPKPQLQTLDLWRSTREPIKSRCVCCFLMGDCWLVNLLFIF